MGDTLRWMLEKNITAFWIEDAGRYVRISAPAPAAPAHWPMPTLVVTGYKSVVMEMTHMADVLLGWTCVGLGMTMDAML